MNSEPWENLPEKIRELKQLVGAIAHKEVTIQFSENENGAMTYEWIGGYKPKIFCKEYSDGGLAEELHHMMLELKGYKRPQGVECRITNQAPVILFNVLQHQVIFPKLEAMGYSQKVGECEAVCEQLTSPQVEDFDATRFVSERNVIALFAMLYVRSALYCSEEVFDEVTRVRFQLIEYDLPRKMAKKILGVLNLDENSKAAHYNNILRQCLDILGFKDVGLYDPYTGSKS